MNVKTLQELLDVNNRNGLFSKLLEFFESLNQLQFITVGIHDTGEGKIPIINVAKNLNIDRVKHVKLFVGAQHNEYNGLFGILELLKQIYNEERSIHDILIDDQVVIFAPLMNPFGFLNPKKDNKSGYYLKNGMNLNRFWRKVFIPEFEEEQDELNNNPIPDAAKLIERILHPYWEREDIKIYIIDFHETSLLERFPRELSMELTNYYKFDHWLKKAIIKNIIDLNGVNYHGKLLFYKCNPLSDHDHVNLSIKQVDFIREKLFEYMVDNQDKLSFYFVHSRKSKEYSSRLVNIIHERLKDILWETTFPLHDHEFYEHGCLVKMNDATTRDNLYCIELENQKQFFNIFEEIERSKNIENYFQDKLDKINKSLLLVKETIIETIKSF